MPVRRDRRGQDGLTSVMLVDDQPVVLTSLALSLEDFGYRVRPFANAADAARALAEEPFDVLVTDVEMPAFEGCALARTAERLQPGIRIIVMSAYDFPEACGPYRRLAKPFRICGRIQLK